MTLWPARSKHALERLTMNFRWHIISLSVQDNYYYGWALCFNCYTDLTGNNIESDNVDNARMNIKTEENSAYVMTSIARSKVLTKPNPAYEDIGRYVLSK